MTSPSSIFRQHIARLAEIPTLFKATALPLHWDRDEPGVSDARRQLEIRQFLYTFLPDFGLPGAVFDAGGCKVLSVDETEKLPENLALPESNDDGVAFRACNGRLVVLFNLRRYWPAAPDGALWLALELERAFVEESIVTSGAGLTNSEYQLLACLLAGLDLKEAAVALNTSYDTKRKQLQVIFQKFDVASQAALTRTLSIRLLGYFTESFGRRSPASPERALLRRHYGRDVLVHSVALENGTELPVWEFGDRKGKPCLYFHSLLSPTVLCDDKIEILNRNGLRWLVVPRFFSPGASGADPSRFLETQTEAVAEYICHFVGGPVTCVATNSGISWAVHFAARFPELTECLMLAGVPYPPSMASGSTNRGLQSALTNVSRKNPHVFAALVRAYAAIARKPELAGRAYRHGYRESPADLAVIERYLETGWALDWLSLIAERSTTSIVADLTVNQRDWAAQAKELPVPVSLLQGAQDKMCPPEVASELATQIAAPLAVVPNAGHLLVASHFELLAAHLRDAPSERCAEVKTSDEGTGVEQACTSCV
ncbi:MULTISPECIES: alpha/beta hydrolase [unclassified Martelella]|uniref:alpha/beta hydrolase n=1 Tax=unclassified Martelella TaxID=2629616 RepID=UPI0025C61F06|nr:alpha/beta hydrolase [Martelella sp.]